MVQGIEVQIEFKVKAVKIKVDMEIEVEVRGCSQGRGSDSSHSVFYTCFKLKVVSLLSPKFLFDFGSLRGN